MIKVRLTFGWFRGKDNHSMFADPMFEDAEGYDFRLQPESPAFKLGFRPIDMTDIGPRAKPGLKTLEEKTTK